MLVYLAYCFRIFFVVLEIIVLLYLFRNIFPAGAFLKYFLLTITAPILFPIQCLMKHSILNTFRVDISPYILLLVLSYLQGICSWLLRQ